MTSPARKALNRLSSQGLVEHMPGAGTFVHRTVVDAARNEILSRIVEDKGVLARMCASLNELRHEVTVATIEQVVETHGALIASIEAGDRVSAREQTAGMLRHGINCVLGDPGNVPH